MNENARPSFTSLGHATIRCDLPGGEVMLIDPWINNPKCPETLKTFARLDSMLITHGHFDHISDAVELARHHEPESVVANPEVCHWLASKGVDNLRELNTGGKTEILGCTVTMTWALHSSGILDGDRMVYGGNPGGYVVETPGGYTFYHMGDTDLFSDLRLIAEFHDLDLVFMPIGDNYTMGPRSAAHAARLLDAGTVIPIHWGTFPLLTGTPEDFAREWKELGVGGEMVVLHPGDVY